MVARPNNHTHKIKIILNKKINKKSTKNQQKKQKIKRCRVHSAAWVGLIFLNNSFLFIFTSYMHHTYIIHTSYIHHTYIIHTSYIHHTYIIHTSYIHHTYIIHTSYIHHTSYIQHLNHIFFYNSHIFKPKKYTITQQNTHYIIISILYIISLYPYHIPSV